MKTKVNILEILEALIIIFATVGITIALASYELDGYSHPAKRLLYFTNLSNVWMAVSALILIFYRRGILRPLWLTERRVYLIKYVFTVSITITGFVYCAILAPFAPDGYRAFSTSSVMTHIIVPTLSIADLFVDRYAGKISLRDVFLTTAPPLLYFLFSMTLSLLNVDFGLGDPYPYFFLNLKSPAGFFGFSDIPPFIFGTFYWMLIFLSMVLSFAFLFAFLRNKLTKSKRVCSAV